MLNSTGGKADVPKYTIINLDRPAHWVPILNNNKKVRYHNSSSNPPPPVLLKALKHYISKTNKKLYINNVQEQFYPETNCGPRAVEYLLSQQHLQLDLRFNSKLNLSNEIKFEPS